MCEGLCRSDEKTGPSTCCILEPAVTKGREVAGGAFILGTLGSDLTVSQAPRTLYVSKIRELVGSRHKDWFLKMGLAGAGLEELALSRAAEYPAVHQECRGGWGGGWRGMSLDMASTQHHR